MDNSILRLLSFSPTANIELSPISGGLDSTTTVALSFFEARTSSESPVLSTYCFTPFKEGSFEDRPILSLSYEKNDDDFESPFSKITNPKQLVTPTNSEEQALFKALINIKDTGSILKSNLGNEAFFGYSSPSNDPDIILKPANCEPGSSLFLDSSIQYAKFGLIPGEGVFNEYLAYRFYKKLNELFNSSAYVPTTSIITVNCSTASRNKETNDVPCSIQEFIKRCKSFSALTMKQKDVLEKDSLCFTAIFDILMANTDRHPDNLLLDDKNHIVLIDNGLILPRKLASYAGFCWQDLQQLKEPISASISALVEHLDNSLLEGLLKELSSIKNFSMENFEDRLISYSTALILLKKGIEKNLTLYEISRFFTKDVNDPSDFSVSLAYRILQKWLELEKTTFLSLEEFIDIILTKYSFGKIIFSEKPLEEACTGSLESCKRIIESYTKKSLLKATHVRD